jgi:hypothetical protein
MTPGKVYLIFFLFPYYLAAPDAYHLLISVVGMERKVRIK